MLLSATLTGDRARSAGTGATAMGTTALSITPAGFVGRDSGRSRVYRRGFDCHPQSHQDMDQKRSELLRFFLSTSDRLAMNFLQRFRLVGMRVFGKLISGRVEIREYDAHW